MGTHASPCLKQHLDLRNIHTRQEILLAGLQHTPIEVGLCHPGAYLEDNQGGEVQ